ncbi:MAG: hypothetical protein HKN54_08460 [Flavobacteriaceae bacterium]|nr:hypothetical protein [Flavobacteriaceae bacterium]
MQFKTNVLILFLISFTMATAQDNKEAQLPYYEIPDYPETYNACTVAARLIDGLGFRYYWATEGLRDEDLAFKPSEEGRTTAETIDHLFGLTRVIMNSTLKKPNIQVDREEMTFAEKRKKTLEQIKTAADILRQCEDLSQFTIVFERGDNSSEYPFWNNINGPIADALWHCGQVVSHRRTSGNPFNSKVSVFSGKLRN